MHVYCMYAPLLACFILEFWIFKPVLCFVCVDGLTLIHALAQSIHPGFDCAYSLEDNLSTGEGCLVNYAVLE